MTVRGALCILTPTLLVLLACGPLPGDDGTFPSHETDDDDTTDSGDDDSTEVGDDDTTAVGDDDTTDVGDDDTTDVGDDDTTDVGDDDTTDVGDDDTTDVGDDDTTDVGDDDDDDSTPPGPGDVSFSMLPGGQGGPSFVIGGELYVVFGGQILRLDNGQFDLVLDTSPAGLNCQNGYNVEVLGDRAYFLGGHYQPDGNCTDGLAGATDAVGIFDPAAGTFIQGPAMPRSREVMASGVVGGSIWVIGGWNPDNNPDGDNWSEVDRFDGVSWTTVTTSGDYTPIRSAAYAAVGDEIYLFGGCEEPGGPHGDCPCNTQYVQVFDTVTATFWQEAEMPLSGRHFSGQHAAVRGDHIYVFGGATGFGCTVFDDIARLDTAVMTWEVLQSTLTRERKSVGAAVLGDELYVFGGMTCDPVLGCAELNECDHQGQIPNCPHAGAGDNEVGVFF